MEYASGTPYELAAPEEQVYPPRKRHHVGRILLGLLLTLGILAVAADRIIVGVVQRQVVSSVLAGAPGSIEGADVQIHGFPFLTQVLSGRLEELSGTMESGNFGGLTVQDLNFDATGVTPREPFHAEHAQANALLPYSGLEQMVAQQVAGIVADPTVTADPANPGTLLVTGNVFGIDVALDARPVAVPPSGMRIDIDQVNLAGNPVDVDTLPFGIGDQLHNFAFELPLPEGIQLTGIDAESNGLRVQVAADDVNLQTVFE